MSLPAKCSGLTNHYRADIRGLLTMFMSKFVTTIASLILRPVYRRGVCAVFLCKVFVILQSMVLPSVALDETNGAVCEASDLKSITKQYEQLACDGAKWEAAGNYKAAADTYERALQVQLFEFPNFVLFPRLALVYHKLGADEAAARNLEQARLSVSVFTGVIACETREGTLQLVELLGGNVVTSPVASDVAYRMCADEYENYYKYRTMESIVKDAELINAYLSAKEKIENIR